MKRNIFIFTVFLMIQFITKGIEIEIKPADEMLNEGISINNTEMIDKAILNGANVNNVGFMALGDLFRFGNNLALIKLLFYGYNPYKKNEQGENLFQLSNNSKRWATIGGGNEQQQKRELTRSYLDSYERNTKNIMEYIQGNNINNLVNLISDQSYLLNSPYSYGNALYFTIIYDKPELFKLLLQLGANPNYSFSSQSGKKWDNINQYLNSDNFKNNIEIRNKEIFKKYLVRFINITNKTTQVKGRIKKYLDEANKGLPVHVPAPSKERLAERLYLAVVSDDIDGVRRALAAGADIREPVQGKNAIAWANSGEHKEILELLVGQKIPEVPKVVYKKDASKASLAERLYVAVVSGDVAEVRKALADGADEHELFDGKTAIEWARLSDQKEILEILEQHGVNKDEILLPTVPGGPGSELPKAPGGPVK